VVGNACLKEVCESHTQNCLPPQTCFPHLTRNDSILVEVVGVVAFAELVN